MQTKHIGLLLSLATSLLAADIFSTSVPESCSTICQPVSDLTSQCDKGSSSPREGCICLNDSFDVAVIGGLCDSCLMQNKVEIKELQSLSSACQFETASYNPQATALVQGITVADVNTAATMSSMMMSSDGTSITNSGMEEGMPMTMTMTTTNSRGQPTTTTMTMTGTAAMTSMTAMSGGMNSGVKDVQVPLEKLMVVGYLGLLWGVFGGFV